MNTAQLLCASVSQLIGEMLPRVGPVRVKALLVPKHSIAERTGSALGCGRPF